MQFVAQHGLFCTMELGLLKTSVYSLQKIVPARAKGLLEQFDYLNPEAFILLQKIVVVSNFAVFFFLISRKLMMSKSNGYSQK